MCWKHQSIYRQCLPNSHSIKTTTQPLLEVNLFEPNQNIDAKYVHIKLQHKFQENKNNTPVGVHAQKQSAMQRPASDTDFKEETRTKKKTSLQTLCFTTGAYKKSINSSDHWHGIGRNCAEKWKKWPNPNRRKKNRKKETKGSVTYRFQVQFKT